MSHRIPDPPLEPPRDYGLSAWDEERLDCLARSVAEEHFPDAPRLADLELAGPIACADGYRYRARWSGREVEIILEVDVLNLEV